MNPRTEETLNAEEMSCEELVGLVTDYMEGTLPAPDRARFDLHLEECPGCVNYVSQMQQVVATLGSLPADEIEPEALDELLVAFRDWKRTG